MKAKTKTTYEFDLDEVKAMFAKNLKVPVNEITVEYTLGTKEYTGRYADPRDDNSYKVVTGIKVTQVPKK